MTVKLDGTLMTDRNTAHDYLKSKLELPDYYGRNLDALFDILTERLTPVNIEIYNSSHIEYQLGEYGNLLISTLMDAAEENPFLEIKII